MKRLGWMILALALFAALPLAAETMTQCIINCPPGNNACSQCCMAQFDAAKGPCYGACQSAQQSCFDAAWQSCQNSPNPRWCYQQASSPCIQAMFACQRSCDGSVQIAGGCPGEVPPQKCPYDCQMWNPASQSCIGPTMNGCPPMTATAEAETDIYAERAKAAADAAEAHTKTLQEEAKQKKSKKNTKK